MLEEGPEPSPAQVRALCDRTRGFGADGVLVPIPTQDAEYGVRIWNPDGSEAEKSGNGLRIFARWLVDRQGAGARFSVYTAGGVVSCAVEPDGVEVEMGRASFAPQALPMLGEGPEFIEAPLHTEHGAYTFTALSVGNPHAVHFTEGDPEALPWRALGAAVERHPVFPRRVNVQFAQVLGPNLLALRIWERGAGETSASGSSSCAVAAAAVRTGRARFGPISLHMPGGTLRVVVGTDWSLTLQGPVTPVGLVAPDPGWLAATDPDPHKP